ncbi:MAG: hypothetical protein ACODAQ_05750 [Phycisphaeraceae bacterium]
MRYRFRGLKRDTGKAVEGHVEAPTEEMAYQVLGDHGVVTEDLRPDPRPRPAQPAGPNAAQGSMAGQSGGPAGAWDIADAIESAFDTSASQVAVDRLAERFRGQRVKVIDREKIRRRVMQVVEQAIMQGQKHEETHDQVRDRIASAMEEMFKDNRNLTSQAQQQAQQQGSEALERQIQRLSQVTESMERAVANLVMVLRSGGGRGGGPARYTHEQRDRNEAQDAVLLEIFETNLELRREGDENGSTETVPDDQAAPPGAASDQAQSEPSAS